MITVHEGTAGNRRTIAIEDFERRFMEICEAQRAQGRAWVFALILYDITHPHVRRALADDGYWMLLDQLSGTSLTVFSFDRPPRNFERYIVGEILGDYMECVEVQGTPNKPGYCVDAVVSERSPAVMFFQVDEGEIVDTRMVTIESRDVDGAFREIEGLIRRVVGAVTNLKPACDPDPQDVFNLVKGELENRDLQLRFVRVGTPVLRSLEAAGLAHLLSQIIRGIL